MKVYDQDSVREIGQQMLKKAVEVNVRLGTQGDAEVQTSKDIVLQADIAISRAVERLVRASGIEAVLWTEEFGRTNMATDPKITIAFDDIDGTYNKKDGEGILPYCSIVTIFDGANPTYGDAMYAGIVIHGTQHLFEAVREKGVFKNGKKIERAIPTRLEKDSRIYINSYETARRTPEAIAGIGRLESRTIPRDVLSSGVAFALVAQHGVAYIGGSNKAHELGAGYLFMKEMGGGILDFQGRDIGGDIYDFNESKSMIAAVNLGIVEEILQEIRKQN